MSAIDKVIYIAQAELGYIEKNVPYALDSKNEGGGSGNYTKYWRDVKPEFQGEPWCACFVTWCFLMAFGKADTTRLLKHYPYTYCPTMAQVFDTHDAPHRGDIVIFKRGGTFVHTGIVTWVSGGKITTIEGNTSGYKDIVANGGAVCKKTYNLKDIQGSKFCTPDWAIVEGDELTMTQYEELKSLIEKMAENVNKAGEEIQEIKDAVQELKEPMVYDYMDENVPEWSREAIQWCLDNGILHGIKDDEGNIKLNLTDDKIWTLNIIYRIVKGVKAGAKI